MYLQLSLHPSPGEGATDCSSKDSKDHFSGRWRTVAFPLVTGWNKNANQLRAVEHTSVLIWYHNVMCVIRNHMLYMMHIYIYNIYHTLFFLEIVSICIYYIYIQFTPWVLQIWTAINRRLRHFDPFGCELWCVTLVWNHCWFGTGSFPKNYTPVNWNSHRKIHHERWYVSAKMMIFSWLR